MHRSFSPTSSTLTSRVRIQPLLALALPVMLGVTACTSAPVRRASDPAARSTADSARLAPYAPFLAEPVYLPSEVDRAARLLSPIPTAGLAVLVVGGCSEAEVEFIVDSAGRPVTTAPVRVVRATTAAFGDAVRRGIADRRYRPAERGGRKVAQLVSDVTGIAAYPGAHGPPAGEAPPRCSGR